MKPILAPLALAFIGCASLTAAEPAPNTGSTLDFTAPAANVVLRAPDATDIAALAERAELERRLRLLVRDVPIPQARNLLISLKFEDELLARARGGDGVSLLDSPRSAAFIELAGEHALQFRPQIPLDDALLERVESRAAERSGRAQPDLRGMFFVGAPLAGTTADAHAITVALNAHPAVEFATVRSLENTPPPPEDIAPPTPSYRHNQWWRDLGSVNGGAGIDYAWSYLGRGAGVRVVDIEQAYNPGHEDIVDLGIENLSVGSFATDSNFVNHGTKTLGVLAAPDNGYGVVGAAPLASYIGFASNNTDDTTGLLITCPDPAKPVFELNVQSWTGRAIATATDNLLSGDVMLLEVQGTADLDPTSLDFVPAETEPAVFCTTKLATDAGIIVVAAAGNGNVDLDTHPELGGWRAWGDSAAIIVGSGTPDTDHIKFESSSFGSRVDVQAWGLNVVTTSSPGGLSDNQNYTDFTGTSSASAVVAATCMAVQSARVARTPVAKLDSNEMRTLLVATGNPQTPSALYPGDIGPAVDAQRAIDTFVPEIDRDDVNDGSLPIFYTFGSTTMAKLEAWDPVEDANAANVEIVSSRLLLENGQPGFLNTPVHSIADWHLEFSDPIDDLIMEFDHIVLSDDFDAPELESYLGMADTDGLFISNDGALWTRICIPGLDEQTPTDGRLTYVTNLSQAAATAGFPLHGHIRIRFQRYGPNEPAMGNGRAFDSIRLYRGDRGEVSLLPSEINMEEGETRELVIARAGNTSFETSVDYELEHITASSTASDYVEDSDTITFLPGETEKLITVKTKPSHVAEFTETFRVVLKKPNHGARLSPNDQTLVRILDGDWEPPRYAHFAAPVSADIPASSPMVGISGPPPIPLEVSGVDFDIGSIRINISDLSHERASDLDIFIEHPNGDIRKLMSDYGAGGTADTTPLEHDLLAFTKDGTILPATIVPGAHVISTGTWMPFDHQLSPADRLLDGTVVNAPAEIETLEAFDPNGTWKLHIVDDFQDTGGMHLTGELLGGWELIFEREEPEPYLPEILSLELDPSANMATVIARGTAGEFFRLTRSSDCVNWTEHRTGLLTGAVQRIVFPNSAPQRFFRFEEFEGP